ncbi:MAG: SDR family NAD(P)-dependent oxidoreductase [Balneolaceae bacterium]|nr:SDR family NAD(P)-dependent oxidoreductase [Balneolaceae bacterium]
MNLNLEGKVAIVTGGSKGIGKGIAESLAEEGCNLSICARHQEELQKTGSQLENHGVDVLAVPADLTRKIIFRRWLTARWMHLERSIYW